MKVSIALATYNGEQYLREQLESYLSQQRQPDELVVCDDCSSDGTVSMLEDFAAQAPFPVTIARNGVQRGAVSTFGRALAIAAGDIVFLSDQDDVWLPHKISVVLDLQQAHPEKMAIMTDAAICHGDLTRTGLTKLGQMRSAGYPRDAFVMGCCAAVRSELLRLCLPIPDDVRGHDNWLVSYSYGLDATLVSNEVLQLYRRHGANQSNVLPNRTTRIGRVRRAGRQVASALARRGEATASYELEFALQLKMGFERGIGRCGGVYDAQLLSASERQDSKIDVLVYRRELRGRGILLRLPLVLRYWLLGGYAQCNGFRSAIRDILG